MGKLMKNLDDLLLPENPILIQGFGIGVLSLMWMIWGSDDYWGLVRVGVLFIPVALLWLSSPKQKKTRRIQEHSFSPTGFSSRSRPGNIKASAKRLS